ncbi:hypothetical protein F66182_3445 [Fusarium sp. NRRL 66182]|nr:hypothetical protein F66182_3445 [Fusarium sp. NRRL 66182]
MGSLDASLPPFPDDELIVPISHLSFENLASCNREEERRLICAAQSDGFFYLDLTNHRLGQALLDEAERVFEFSKEALNLPFEQKMQFVEEKSKDM